MGIWWEKTVEYAFVKDYVPRTAIAPLAGNHEASSSDAIASKAGQFCLIEFKRTNKKLNEDHMEKFTADNFTLYKKYIECKKERNYTIPHVFIYGELDSNAVLHLKCVDYMPLKSLEDDPPQWRPHEIENLPSVCLKEFKEYLRNLADFREKGAAGGSIVGLDEKGNITVIFDYDENTLEFGLLRDPAIDDEPSHSDDNDIIGLKPPGM